MFHSLSVHWLEQGTQGKAYTFNMQQTRVVSLTIPVTRKANPLALTIAAHHVSFFVSRDKETDIKEGAFYHSLLNF